MNDQSFTYQYSAQKHKEVESIRKKYLPQTENKVDTLRRMDMRVQTAGIPESLVLGVIGCLLFGVGMCFGLQVLSGPSWFPWLFGLVGIALMIPAYPTKCYLSKKTRQELTPRILQLSEDILSESISHTQN